MQTDVYIKIINEKMNMEFWMAGFLVIPKVYAVIASPFTLFFRLAYWRKMPSWERKQYDEKIASNIEKI